MPTRSEKVSPDTAEARVLAAQLQLHESIEALSYSFSSSGLIERLLEHDRDHSRHRLKSAGKLVQKSPLAFALVGAGLALLVARPMIERVLRRPAVGAAKPKSGPGGSETAAE